MKKEEWNEGLNHLDSDLVEEYVRKKEQLTQENKMPKGFWLRVGAVAACLVLMIGVMAALQEYKPPVPVWENAMFSAEEIGEMFGNQKYDGGTNAYTEIYVPDAKYLYIDPIPEDAYLGIYQSLDLKTDLNKDRLRALADGILPKLAKSLGVCVPSYEIEESIFSGESISAEMESGNYLIRFRQTEVGNELMLSKAYGDYAKDGGYAKIILDGETVQIDQRLSDEEILKSLESVKNKLFDIFGVSFPDAKIFRWYDDYQQNGATSITIYFYDESAHAMNLYGSLASNRISIEFDNFKNYEGDIVSDSVLTQATIRYNQYHNDRKVEIPRIATAKKISLAEAEALLYNGYVFGGHRCSLCMAAQENVNFEGYDFVDIEYVFGYDKQTRKFTVAIPFYAFYKKIGTATNGNAIYAKTYVAAIEVSDYESYFESQKSQHKK